MDKLPENRLELFAEISASFTEGLPPIGAKHLIPLNGGGTFVVGISNDKKVYGGFLCNNCRQADELINKYGNMRDFVSDLSLVV